MPVRVAALIRCSRLDCHLFSGVCTLADVEPTIRGDDSPTDYFACFVQLMCVTHASDQPGRHSVVKLSFYT